MYEHFYERVSAPWRNNGVGGTVLARIDAALRIAVAAGYGALLVWLFATGDQRLLRAVLVPAVTFALVTMIRAAINAPRPYEAHAIRPLIHKDTQGHSMPSRHMASATIIACTLFWAAGPVWGAVGFAACAAIAYTRIVGGVHFPRDIAAGAVMALLAALLGYLVIP